MYDSFCGQQVMRRKAHHSVLVAPDPDARREGRVEQLHLLAYGAVEVLWVSGLEHGQLKLVAVRGCLKDLEP